MKLLSSLFNYNKLPHLFWMSIIFIFSLIFNAILEVSLIPQLSTKSILVVLSIASLLFSRQVIPKINTYLGHFFMILLLLLLAQFKTIIPSIQYIIMLLGLIVFVLECKKLTKNTLKSFILLPVILIIISFIYINFYDQDYQSLFFIEKILLGKAHVDTMFHISISNMFDKINYASVGINGFENLKYHYGSHYLFSKLSLLIGIKPTAFYNVVYPLLFIPYALFLLKNVSKDLYSHIYNTKINPVLILLVIGLLFTSPLSIYFNTFNGESFLISLLLSFLLFGYVITVKKYTLSHYIMIIFWILAISICKVSTGFYIGLVFGIFYLKLRKINSIEIGIIGLLGLISAYLLINNFILTGRAEQYNNLSILLRYKNIIAKGFFQSFLPLLLLPYLVYTLKPDSLRSVLKNNSFILLISIGLSTIGVSLLVSHAYNDVATFVKTQIYLILPFIIIYSIHEINKRVSIHQLNIFLILICLGTIVYFPETTYKIDRNRITYNNYNEHKNTDLNQLYHLLSNKDFTNQNVLFYIPKSETWFHNAQQFRTIASNFTIQTLIGKPVINSLSPFTLKHQEKRYGIGPVLDNIMQLQNFSDDQLLNHAKANGFNIIYKITKHNTTISLQPLR